MNIENIKALAEIVSANGLTSLEIEEGATKIYLEKATVVQAVETIPAAIPVTTAQMAPSVAAEPAPQPAAAVSAANLTEVTSPLVGVFYSAPSPDSEPYVKIGSKVKKGDVLCIIEAMKVMNEIMAEKDGEIVDICVKNGEIADFGQVLFKMD